MAQRPQDSPQLDALLQAVSRKLGVPADTLKAELKAGKFDAALSGMKPKEAAAFQQLLNNPGRLQQMMNSQQAKALYEKLKQ
ncbi:MAG: hypothetical protein IJC75_02020 [Oscillospiraceae bacterium]|nr:hypothetical protein [Ruminococcus sp.]MBQ4345892.1 hypothetical protein [Oscillospiraceae bacterium]